jgi:tetratricopeptide (TPR) repeat protein
MIRLHRAALAALVFTLGVAGLLHAAGEGRVIGTIVDGKGAPIEGARALLTRPGTGYKLEKKSDKKGQFTLLILDATHEYQILVEKEGYGSFEGPVKAPLGEIARLTFTLEKTVAPDPASGQPVLDGAGQAIEAYNEGVKLLQGGDLAGASGKFQQASDLDPKLPDAPAALADVLLELKKPAEALAAADRFLALKPGDARGLRARFDAQKALGDNAKARETLEALAKADPSRETAVRLLNEGIGFFNAGKAAEALPLFQSAAAADPTLVKAQYMLGLAYVNAGDPAKAKEHLQKFLELAPNDPEAATAKEMLESLK